MTRFTKYLFIVWVFISSVFYGQVDTQRVIKVHFLYGSKPYKSYRNTEVKYFGGIHGGHVSIQVDSMDYGFSPAKGFHIFPRRKKFKSDYVEVKVAAPQKYPLGSKVATVVIPVTESQYQSIRKTCMGYCVETPYDYAFFGMRCASSAQDVLAQAGLVKSRGRFYNIVTTFYPKKLRKRVFKLATINHYKIIEQPGRSTRKWEKD